jgi:pimeloyl-ACP methyl ester carboxylesterase
VVPTGKEWKIKLCVAHGGLLDDPELFAPSERHYYNDKWVRMTHWACSQNKIRGMWYTARGYGHSSGWKWMAREHTDQFSWATMGQDMAELMGEHARTGYIAMGNSTGAAAALHAALPEHNTRSGKLQGLVLMRLPGAFEHAGPRKEKLQATLATIDDEYQASVIQGAIDSELPSLDRLRDVDFKVLILAVTDCPYHPVETSEQIFHALKRMDPENTRTTIYRSTTEEAEEAWPGLISHFVADVKRLCKLSKKSSFN